ncbi:hypothetical protein AABB24_019997, partial [Solanum stoloniferum]
IQIFIFPPINTLFSSPFFKIKSIHNSHFHFLLSVCAFSTILLKAKMAYSKVIIALMLAFIAGSAFAQAPGASPAASPKSSPSPVATPPSTTSTPPVSAPANAPTTASSPLASPPAPPTTETPSSSPSGAASPPSIAAAPGGSPTESPNSASLNRVAVAGSAVVAVFAAALML